MARLTSALTVVVLGLLAAGALASCGGGGADLLAGETADEITQNLDRVEELASEGDCLGAEEATAEVALQVEELQVDSRLQAALSDGVDRLSERVGECQQAEEEEEPTETVDTAEEPETTEAEEQSPPGKGKKDEAEQPEEEAEENTTPPSSEEQGKSEEAPPSEAESPSGGLGPGEPAEGE